MINDPVVVSFDGRVFLAKSFSITQSIPDYPSSDPEVNVEIEFHSDMMLPVDTLIDIHHVYIRGSERIIHGDRWMTSTRETACDSLYLNIKAGSFEICDV
jgi:hypothetical protein